MTTAISSALRRGKAFLTPSSSSTSIPQVKDGSFITAPEGTLFPTVDPAIDGEDCTHHCESCSIHYPAKFSIDEDEKLYGCVNGWATHMLVATGRTDWVRDVADEKGSVMEAVRDCGVEPKNGKLMLSASNIPTPHDHHSPSDPTTILLLPAFTIIENVTPASVPQLITHHINPAPTNTSSLPSTISSPLPSSSPFTSRPCPHQYLILLCSQRTRDARCGQSAPLLRREFERHLRPLGMYRDLHDERPGGVGVYFISHVGGHKFAANVMVYRRGGVVDVSAPPGQSVKDAGTGDGKEMNGDTALSDGVEKEPNNNTTISKQDLMQEATQCIWLARVKPEDCEGIIKFTVLQGKVVHPERQLRGGFDRGRGLVSW
ncbi:MAG: hypothetical protein Q9174_006813 [Haloplaca sp. 1 TL-2023]